MLSDLQSGTIEVCRLDAAIAYGAACAATPTRTKMKGNNHKEAFKEYIESIGAITWDENHIANLAWVAALKHAATLIDTAGQQAGVRKYHNLKLAARIVRDNPIKH